MLFIIHYAASGWTLSIRKQSEAMTSESHGGKYYESSQYPVLDALLGGRLTNGQKRNVWNSGLFSWGNEKSRAVSSEVGVVLWGHFTRLKVTKLRESLVEIGAMKRRRTEWQQQAAPSKSFWEGGFWGKHWTNIDVMSNQQTNLWLLLLKLVC